MIVTALLALLGLVALIVGSRARLPGNGLLGYSVRDDLYVQSVDGSRRLLATGVGRQAMWSRDGSHIATLRSVLTRTREVVPYPEIGRVRCSAAQPTCVDEVVVTDLSGRSAPVGEVPYMGWLLDWSPDGQAILVEARSDGKSPPAADGTVPQDVWLVWVDGRAPIRVGYMLGGFNARFTGAVDAPIVYRAEDGSLRISDLDGRTVREIATGSEHARQSMVFDVAADGEHVFIERDGELLSVALDGSTTRLAMVGTTGVAAVSPDGSRVVFDGPATTGDGASMAFITTVDGAGPQAPLVPGRSVSWCAWSPAGTSLLCANPAPSIVDLATRTVTSLPDAQESLFVPSWQPVRR